MPQKLETPETEEVTLEETIRERAYLNWEEAGCPEGCADEFWLEAEATVLDETETEDK